MLESATERKNYMNRVNLINNRIKKLHDQQNEVNKKVDSLQKKYVKSVLIKTEKDEVS